MSTPTLRREQVAGMNIHYLYHSLEYFLDTQQRLGFRTIELWCAAPHVWLDHLSYTDARVLAKQIADRELAVHVLTPENCVYQYQFAAKEPDLREKTFGYFANGIRLAEELGCASMEVNSGWGYWNEDPAQAWARSREMLGRLADFAAPRGISLVMEALRPQESQLVTTLATTRQMLDEVGRPNLRPMIDTCAMSVAGETLDDWFGEFGAEIGDIHFIDSNPYGHLVWGDGNRDLGAYVAALNRHGYSGYLGQEITDERYYADPAAADAQNMSHFERYITN